MGKGECHDLSFKERIEAHYPRLGKQRQRVLKYVNDHLPSAVFLTASQLAQRVGVNAATVVRTAQDLGFRGYSDFIESARACFLESRTPFEIAQRGLRESSDPESSVLVSIYQEIDNLRRMAEAIDPGQIVKLARRIRKARRSLIIGLDLAATLSSHLEYLLQSLGLDAQAATAGSGRLRNRLLPIGPRDLVLAITFRRGLRETVEAATKAREAGAYTVAITDSELSPLVKVCHEYILAPIVSQSFAGSYVAPLAVLNALMIALTKCDPSFTLEALGKLSKEYESGNRWC